MLAVVLSLFSASAYGVSDFVGGVASRKVEALRVVLVSYPVSAVVIAAAALFAGGTPTPNAIVWGTASGVVMALAMLWFYQALSDGPMSIVSPTTAIIVAALPAAVGIIGGERPPVIAYVGIALALVAVVLVSRESKTRGALQQERRFTARVAWLTVGAGTFFALSFVFTHQITPGTGLWPLVAARAVASCEIVVIAAARKQATLPPFRLGRLAVSIGLLDVVANLTMLCSMPSKTVC
ncbi:EamA family transporter [Curtobacterium sp. ISL-83]|uniref:EamA family transporter n=1 Tax=Curtobacterium sp. ISL-83 TaxID=2819145 RepID=UPI001BEBE788|nr:EamA family transporter [Curtobacterium sp. ISL-83]MBT2504187.1 EamA family transporter [Curtobacterium sp. ISL-83]